MTEGNYARKEHDAKMEILAELSRFSLIAALNPKIFIDGDQWCVLYGENIQDVVCGFGVSPWHAVTAFNAAWNKRIEG